MLTPEALDFVGGLDAAFAPAARPSSRSGAVAGTAWSRGPRWTSPADRLHPARGQLREHSSGLDAGRWDHLFSLVKALGHRPDFRLPDRARRAGGGA
ncbi:hypothetical protein ACFYOG_27725 [Streptomyces sp. NPDC007818]|uniref:hypothetical protein n=1 Tax=Streptomyces sp. NPDC007818 TaxID=3364780 RepID=UPI00367927A0